MKFLVISVILLVSHSSAEPDSSAEPGQVGASQYGGHPGSSQYGGYTGSFHNPTLVSYPNGAVVPQDTHAVAAAKASHFSNAAYGYGARNNQAGAVPQSYGHGNTGYAHNGYANGDHTNSDQFNHRFAHGGQANIGYAHSQQNNPGYDGGKYGNGGYGHGRQGYAHNDHSNTDISHGGQASTGYAQGGHAYGSHNNNEVYGNGKHGYGHGGHSAPSYYGGHAVSGPAYGSQSSTGPGYTGHSTPSYYNGQGYGNQAHGTKYGGHIVSGSAPVYGAFEAVKLRQPIYENPTYSSQIVPSYSGHQTVTHSPSYSGYATGGHSPSYSKHVTGSQSPAYRGLVRYSNGAQVPVDDPDVAAARASHLAIHKATFKKFAAASLNEKPHEKKSFKKQKHIRVY